MKLFYSPGACSLGIHVILEEIGAPHELARVDLRAGEQFAPAFRAVNPKGRVPALARDDGSVLTEFPAIAVWLALTHPEAGLLPDDPEGEARVLELVDYVVATLHMRGFTLMRMPQKFVSDPAAREELSAAGAKVVGEGLAALAERLGDRDWFLGDYSIADVAVFYLLNWADDSGLAMPSPLAAFLSRMRARPAVRAAMAREGLIPRAERV